MQRQLRDVDIIEEIDRNGTLISSPATEQQHSLFLVSGLLVENTVALGADFALNLLAAIRLDEELAVVAFAVAVGRGPVGDRLLRQFRRLGCIRQREQRHPDNGS
jgi:hypothetical protein